MKLNAERAQQIEQLYNECKHSLVTFRQRILTAPDADNKTNCEPAEFHYRWSDLLLNDERNIAIEAFRESAKSQYVSRIYPLYILTYPTKQTHYIVIIKNNKPLASKQLKDISDEALNNPFIAPKIVKIRANSGDVLDVDVVGLDNIVHKVRIEAYGKGSSVRGLITKDIRPDIILCDDLQDQEDLRSETIPDTDWNWFLSDIKYLGQYTRIFIIGNNLGLKCIMELIAGKANEIGYYFERVGIRDDLGHSTWSAKYTDEYIDKDEEQARAIGKINIWIQERLCLATNDETRTFKQEDFRYYSHTRWQKLKQTCTIFRMVDPSYAMKKGNNDPDPRAIIVVGVDKDNYWYVLDGFAECVTPLQLIEKDFEFARKYKTNVCGWEQYNLYSTFISDKQREFNTFYNIVELKPSGIKKEVRIKERLQPRFASHTILFPDYTDCKWLTMLQEQLLSFPFGKHDDMIDALAYCEDIAYKPVAMNDVNNNNYNYADLVCNFGYGG